MSSENTEKKPQEAETNMDPDTLSFSRAHPGWEEHLLLLIQDKNKEQLQQFFKDLYPADIGYLLERQDLEDALYIYEQLDSESRGEVLLEVNETLRNKIMETISPTEMAEIVLEQESDAAADILEGLKDEHVSEILSYMPIGDRVKITELLSYSENAAGSLMGKEFAAVLETDTVQKAIQTLRKISKNTDDIYTVYVVDGSGKYKGHISLKNLIIANPRVKVKKIMESEILPIPVSMDREEVANFFDRYNFVTAPVVDANGIMIGRITVDDIIDVIQEEASEDILRMGGLSSDETLNSPIFLSSLKRATWLSVNLCTAFLAAFVIKSFQATIEQVVILSALMPIVAGMGGNAASQSMTIIIRNIALGEVSSSNIFRIFKREAFLGLINGLAMGTLTGLGVLLFTGSSALSGVIAAAMIFNLLVAAVSGTLVPIVLDRIQIDPAIASSIFVTTFTDVVGFTIFLGFAYLAMPYLL